MFGIYWLRKTHPPWNTASNKPKVMILKRHRRSKTPLQNVILCSLLRWPSSKYFSIFKHSYAGRVNISLQVHDFCMCVMPFSPTHPEVCYSLEYFVPVHTSRSESMFLMCPGRRNPGTTQSICMRVTWCVASQSYLLEGTTEDQSYLLEGTTEDQSYLPEGTTEDHLF